MGVGEREYIDVWEDILNDEENIEGIKEEDLKKRGRKREEIIRVRKEMILKKI